MFYVYDEALCEDLQNSFNTDIVDGPCVKVCPPDTVISVIDQIKEGTQLLPIVGITRSDDIVIDTDRTNFTRAHKGVTAVMDKETNNLYYEKAIPVKLSYTLTVLTTNTADMDELVRELLFKYTDMYYLTIRLPYEADRKIRFGVVLDDASTIERQSYLSEYVHDGTIYQSAVNLNCEGCVLVNYTPAKLHYVKTSPEFELEDPSPDDEKLHFSYTNESGKPNSVGFDVTRVADNNKNQKFDVTSTAGKNKSQKFDVTRKASNNKSQKLDVTRKADNNKNQKLDVTYPKSTK